jgi:hypothetical protein
VVAIGGAATVALHLRDPHASGSWGYCPTYALFGIYCPACGCLRAVNDLTNGDVPAAIHSNALFIGLVPFFLAMLATWVVRSWRGDPPLLTPRQQQRVVWAISAVAVVFAVIRNLPFAQVLTPV